MEHFKDNSGCSGPKKSEIFWNNSRKVQYVFAGVLWKLFKTKFKFRTSDHVRIINLWSSLMLSALVLTSGTLSWSSLVIADMASTDVSLGVIACVLTAGDTVQRWQSYDFFDQLCVFESMFTG